MTDRKPRLKLVRHAAPSTVGSLTEKQRHDLWGESGPYSEVRMRIEERILDDRVSRIFVYVVVHVNPFTFRFIKKNAKHHADDVVVTAIIHLAEYASHQEGFVATMYGAELTGQEIMACAQEAMAKARAATIRMHRFVMDSWQR